MDFPLETPHAWAVPRGRVAELESEAQARESAFKALRQRSDAGLHDQHAGGFSLTNYFGHFCKHQSS